MGGAAGTGKTTLMHAVGEAARTAGRRVLQLTPTGKAAVRLREKTGHATQTIHSALYGAVEEDEETGKLIWQNPGIEASTGDIIIIDEFSMVGLRLYTDLETAVPPGVTILCVGDHHQLSPVNDLSMFSTQMDVELTEVHRQALDNPILELATATRVGNGIGWLKNYNETDPRLKTGLGLQLLLSKASESIVANKDSIMLCYTNKTKAELNKQIRSLLGHRKIFETGDRIIIRTNNHSIGMMNGEIFTVKKARIYTDKIWGKYGLVHFQERKTPVRISLRHFGCERQDWWNYVKHKPKKFPKNYVHAAYGYAITTHSAQGSEWDNVFYWWEPTYSWLVEANPEEARRLFYTATTRAAQTLTIHR